VKPDSIFKPGLKDHEFGKKKMCNQSERAPMTAAPVDPKWNWWSFCP